MNDTSEYLFRCHVSDVAGVSDVADVVIRPAVGDIE